jgi:hypothetical protein
MMRRKASRANTQAYRDVFARPAVARSVVSLTTHSKCDGPSCHGLLKIVRGEGLHADAIDRHNSILFLETMMGSPQAFCHGFDYESRRRGQMIKSQAQATVGSALTIDVCRDIYARDMIGSWLQHDDVADLFLRRRETWQARNLQELDADTNDLHKK